MRRRAAQLTSVLAFGWLAWVLLRATLTGRWWPMLLPDLVPPLLLVVVPVLLAVVSALAGTAPSRGPRRWLPVTACAAALAVGAGHSGLHFGGWGRGPESVPAQALHLVVWNAQYWHQDDDEEDFYTYLRSFDADVYLLQEYLNWRDGTPVRVDDTAALRARFPGYRIVARGELLTLSRLPVTHIRVLTDPAGTSAPPGSDFPEFWQGKTLRTDVLFGGRPISLYNTHIPVQLDASDGVLTPAFLTGVQRQARRRAAAWSALAGDLACTTGARLVAGDLNTTPAMGELSHLDDLLVRGRPTGGGPYPASWNSRGPALWLLDYVFHNPGIRLDRYRFRDSRGLSDHRAQELWITMERTPDT